MRRSCGSASLARRECYSTRACPRSYSRRCRVTSSSSRLAAERSCWTPVVDGQPAFVRRTKYPEEDVTGTTLQNEYSLFEIAAAIVTVARHRSFVWGIWPNANVSPLLRLLDGLHSFFTDGGTMVLSLSRLGVTSSKAMVALSEIEADFNSLYRRRVLTFLTTAELRKGTRHTKVFVMADGRERVVTVVETSANCGLWGLFYSMESFGVSLALWDAPVDRSRRTDSILNWIRAAGADGKFERPSSAPRMPRKSILQVLGGLSPSFVFRRDPTLVKQATENKKAYRSMLESELSTIGAGALLGVTEMTADEERVAEEDEGRRRAAAQATTLGDVALVPLRIERDSSFASQAAQEPTVLAVGSGSTSTQPVVALCRSCDAWFVAPAEGVVCDGRFLPFKLQSATPAITASRHRTDCVSIDAKSATCPEVRSSGVA